MSKKTPKGKQFVRQAMGTEPIVTSLVSMTDTEVGKLFNWYNEMVEPIDALPWLIDYLNSIGMGEVASRVSAVKVGYIPTSILWLARMANRGAEIGESYRDKIVSKVKSLLEENETRKLEKPKVQPVDRSKAKAKEMTSFLIADVEAMLDNFFMNDYKPITDFQLFNNLKRFECKPHQVEAIKEYYEPLMAELHLAKTKKDRDVVEAYRHLSSQQLDAYFETVSAIFADCMSFLQANKNERAPRKPKQRSAQDLVKNLKYMRSSDEMKVASLDPAKIIGAQGLWIYNDKYRKLGLYRAKDGKGLQVSGTTVLNYDEKASTWKTLRKPERQLQEFMNSGRALLMPFFESVKTGASPIPERINDKTLLLKVDT